MQKAFTPLEIIPQTMFYTYIIKSKKDYKWYTGYTKDLRKRFKRFLSLTGFTLVEVMVATAVLSLGAVLIYETLLASVGAFDYYSDYLYLAPEMEEKIWQAQNNISRFGYAARIQPEGVFTKNNKVFSWNMSYELSGEAGDLELYKISFLLHREGGEKRVEFTRNAYAMYKKEE